MMISLQRYIEAIVTAPADTIDYYNELMQMRFWAAPLEGWGSASCVLV